MPEPVAPPSVAPPPAAPPPAPPPQAHRRWVRLLTRQAPEPTLLNLGMALAAVAAGLVAAGYAASALLGLAEAAQRPEVRMAVVSCEVYTAKGRVPSRQVDCRGRGADGPAGIAAEHWRLRGAGYRQPGELVAVRCTDGGDCRTRLAVWFGPGAFVGGIALAMLTVGGYRSGRLLTARLAPERVEFFTRRSTVRVLVVLGATSLGLVLAAFPAGLLDG
ncbi:hypothetical protein HUT16_35530 [Kitasatospora sp. NA04385]|uniref:hypothetical protein n=1 Tax=Kitasatospora sp. NA04385 TaxID=2742135 RepID=UPI00159197F5|nr:hypothetical protein [Kitasatospora sp. NA04385]QKW23708.1 hypothetical protein HUT16_35530 [Kitasatospora sp. NA04385]